MNPRMRLPVIGGIVGLTWAAGFRGWMVELVGAESTFSWMTVTLILLPGALIGVLLGLAAQAHVAGVVPHRALVWAPALFASALLDPRILGWLVRTGEGSGSLMVVATALCTGYVVTHWRLTWRTSLCALIAASGTLVLGIMGTMTMPLSTPRGAWVCLYAMSFMVVLGLASALPHRRLPRPGRTAIVAIGATCGLAWACGLRAFMVAVAGDGSTFTWVGTFVWILLPGALVGGLLGWAEHLRRSGRPRRGLVAAPLLFAGVLLPGLLQPSTMFEGGIGGGAIGLPIIGMLGAYALAGRWIPARVLGGSLAVAGLAVWALTATEVGGPAFALDTAHGIWATTLLYGLLVLLAVATSIPLRQGSAVTAPVKL